LAPLKDEADELSAILVTLVKRARASRCIGGNVQAEKA
jgi:hypothetical protein